MTTSGLIDGLVDINQENTENKYSQNIDYYQKYIDLLKKNEDLETEKEDYKFNLTRYQDILEPAYNKNIRKLKEEKVVISQEKDFYFANFTKYQKEIEPKYKEEIYTLNQDLSRYENIFKDLKIEYNDKLFQYQKEAERHYSAIIRDLKAENEKLNLDKKRINNNLDKDYPDEKIIELETDIRSKVFMIEAIEKSNQELRTTNDKLRKEASSYQSALGDALNVHLNNSVQLSTDIASLQDRLEKYVTALKGSFIEIDNDKIQELYGKYNLDIHQHKNNKILMKSVLQRHILEKILEYIDNYLDITEDDDTNNPNNQEKYIMNHTNELIFLLDKFYNNHFEQDNNVIKAIPTKIRQQVYGILGEFGFSETCENNKKQYMHPFISSTALELNQLMAGYRYIKNDTKRKNVENMAENLIKDVFRIFKFRLLVQEPKCETLWFEKDVKINPLFMKGQWDDDCLDDYVVDICYFPLIGTELNDSSKSKVCIHAKVFPRSIAPPSPTAEDHPPLNDELQENSSLIGGNIKGIFNKILPPPSSSTPSQNSANSDHNKDPNKRQNSANSDHDKNPNKRQNSANSDRNRDSNKRQNSASNDCNNDPEKRQNSTDTSDVDNQIIKGGVCGGNEDSKIENSENQDIDDLENDGGQGTSEYGEYGNDENSQESVWVAEWVPEKGIDPEKDVDKDGKDTTTKVKISNKKTNRKKKKPGNDFDCM
ncbi:20204_t:CDS:2 [Entrophospora sp. SA101]|nr:20204_t:CDS:2 [Entrophospora sp. SA101]